MKYSKCKKYSKCDKYSKHINRKNTKKSKKRNKRRSKRRYKKGAGLFNKKIIRKYDETADVLYCIKIDKAFRPAKGCINKANYDNIMNEDSRLNKNKTFKKFKKLSQKYKVPNVLYYLDDEVKKILGISLDIKDISKLSHKQVSKQSRKKSRKQSRKQSRKKSRKKQNMLQSRPIMAYGGALDPSISNNISTFIVFVSRSSSNDWDSNFGESPAPIPQAPIELSSSDDWDSNFGESPASVPPAPIPQAPIELSSSDSWDSNFGESPAPVPPAPVPSAPIQSSSSDSWDSNFGESPEEQDDALDIETIEAPGVIRDIHIPYKSDNRRAIMLFETDYGRYFIKVAPIERLVPVNPGDHIIVHDEDIQNAIEDIRVGTPDYTKIGQYLYEARLYDILNQRIDDSEQVYLPKIFDYGMVDLDNTVNTHFDIIIKEEATNYKYDLSYYFKDQLLKKVDRGRPYSWNEKPVLINGKYRFSYSVVQSVLGFSPYTDHPMVNSPHITDLNKKRYCIKVVKNGFKVITKFYKKYGLVHWDLHNTNLLSNNNGDVMLYDFDMSSIKIDDIVTKSPFRNDYFNTIFTYFSQGLGMPEVNDDTNNNMSIFKIGHMYDLYRIIYDYRYSRLASNLTIQEINTVINETIEENYDNGRPIKSIERIRRGGQLYRLYSTFILFFQRWLRDENRLRRLRHQIPLYPRDDEFEDRIIQSYLIFKDSIPNHYGR